MSFLYVGHWTLHLHRPEQCALSSLLRFRDPSYAARPATSGAPRVSYHEVNPAMSLGIRFFLVSAAALAMLQISNAAQREMPGASAATEYSPVMTHESASPRESSVKTEEPV